MKALFLFFFLKPLLTAFVAQKVLSLFTLSEFVTFSMGRVEKKAPEFAAAATNNATNPSIKEGAWVFE